MSERISRLSPCAIAERRRGDGIRDYRRPVSPTEWFYLAVQRIMPPFAIQLVFEGRGRIELSELTAAVAAAAAACPGSRLVRAGRTWRASAGAPTIHTTPDPLICTTSGKLWPQGHSRSKPRRSSQSVTAASNAASSTFALLA